MHREQNSLLKSKVSPLLLPAKMSSDPHFVEVHDVMLFYLQIHPMPVASSQ